VIDAPANEIAIGRKIIDFAIASPRVRRSASVANASPIVTPMSGTMMIHPKVFRIARSMLSSVNTNRKLSRPTKDSPRESLKLTRIVFRTG
jgi:hypothetical protein